MKIVRKDSTTEALQPGELEVHIFSGKDTYSCGKKSHAALRYCLEDNSEHYVSIFPDPNNTSCNPLACLPVEFQTKLKDEDRYTSSAVNEHGIIPMDRYTTSVYRFSGTGIHLDQLHAELRRLQKIRLPQEETNYFTSIDVDRTGAPYNIPTTGMHSPNDQFFKMWSCLSFAWCCTNPLFPSLPGCTPRHNCTSLVVHLLGSAGIVTDLSPRWVWIRFGFQLLWMASIGYATKEVIRTDASNIKADDVLAMIALGLGGGSWLITHALRPLINCSESGLGNFLLANYMRLGALGFPCLTSTEGLLLNNTSASILFGLVTTLYTIIDLIVHACIIPDPFGKGVGYDFLEGTFEGAGIGAGLFLLVQIFGVFRDWQNGCSNPFGLKQVLDGAALFNVARPLTIPEAQVPVPDNQQPLIGNEQL